MVERAAHRRLVSEDQLLPPGPAGAGSRHAILTAALRLFAERGYGGASVRDLAAAAGVQPATLYAHFPSKQHVLAELVRLGHEEHYRRLRAALRESGPEPAAQVAAWVRAHVGMHAAYPTLAVVANAELHALSPDHGAAALELRRQSERELHEVIERGVQRGVFRVPHVWLALAAIGGAGLRVAHWYTPAFELGAAQVAETYALYALRLLGVPDPAPFVKLEAGARTRLRAAPSRK